MAARPMSTASGAGVGNGGGGGGVVGGGIGNLTSNVSNKSLSNSSGVMSNASSLPIPMSMTGALRTPQSLTQVILTFEYRGKSVRDRPRVVVVGGVVV